MVGNRGIGLPYKAENIITVNNELTRELTSRQEETDSGQEIDADVLHEASISALAKLTAQAIQVIFFLLMPDT